MTEAELLFSEVLKCDRLSLYLNKGRILGKSDSFLISAALKRRIGGEPIQYILGKQEFMGMDFKVTTDVFIPRPETEILVETALKIGYRLWVAGYGLKILDIGTGSGCVAISFAKFLSYAKIDACDISKEALGVAKENAKLNNVDVNFIQSNLFSTYHLSPKTYNLIISNPPYIPTPEIKNLQPEISYEPAIALDGGEDGLDFYRKIIAAAAAYLKKDGFLMMEMGFGQKAAIENIFQRSADFEIIEIVKDYNKIDRVIVAKKYG